MTVSTSTCADALSAIETSLSTPGAMDSERFEEFLEKQRGLGLVQGDRPLCHHLAPFVVSVAEYDRIGKAAETVVSALERVAHAALEDPALADALDLSPVERELAAIDPGYPETLAVGRLDMLMGDSSFSFIELNADSPGGITDQLLVERTLFELPHLSPVLGRHDLVRPHPHASVLEALLRVYASAGGHNRPTIALVDFSGVDTLAEIRLLARSFSRQGYRAFFADPSELAYDGKRLTAHGEGIDLVYRRVIATEFLSAHGIDHPLIQAYRDGAVRVANSFRTKAMNKKASFAVLCDPSHASLFTDDQRAVIADHVPWTRRVRSGVVEFHERRVELSTLIADERERFVLKPNDDYGGHGVVLGWKATPEEWSAALALAARESYVVQERSEVRTLRMPTYRDQRIEWDDVYFDLCPFVFAGRMEGAIVRLSSSGITNVSAGASVSSLLVVGDAVPQEQPHV